MKTILLLGINAHIEEYAKNVLKIDIKNDIVYYPSVTAHHTEFHKYINIVKDVKFPVITTQNSELIDVFLNSDLDFYVVTVRKYDDGIRARTLTKKEALDLRETIELELRD